LRSAACSPGDEDTATGETAGGAIWSSDGGMLKPLTGMAIVESLGGTTEMGLDMML